MSVILSEHIPLLATAPGGIRKLRGLILELAVRGKLVPQDPNDEPASEMLKRITQERARLEATGASKKSKPIPPVSQVQKSFTLPMGWEWVPFGNATICRDGERIPVSQDERKNRERLYDYYGASGVIDKIDGFLFDKPLLLIGEDGANLINRSTPIAFIARGKYWVNNHAHVIDGITEGYLRYLELFINAIDLKPYVTGTAQPKMNQAKMNSIPLALPPEREQHRIVEKVDELMVLCDQLEAEQNDVESAHAKLVDLLLETLTQRTDPDDLAVEWQRLSKYFDAIICNPYAVDKLRKAVLCLAAEGRLVPQTGQAECYPLSSIIEGDSLNGCSKKPDNNLSGVQILRISAGTGNADFFVDERDHKWVDATPAEIEKFRLLPDDLLACRFNGNLHYVGSFSLYQGKSGAPQVFPDKLIRFRARRDKVLPHYLRYVLNADPARDQIERFCATTVGNIGISATNLKTVKVRVPSLDEQYRIVARVDELMALFTHLKTDLSESRNCQAQLASTLIASALAAA